jgi:hypothetical protein
VQQPGLVGGTAYAEEAGPIGKDAGASSADQTWAAVAARASRDVGAPPDLLGGFLPDLALAAGGAPPPPDRIDAYRALGRAAAQRGVTLRGVVDLYLTGARHAWPRLTPFDQTAGSLERVGACVLAAVDDVVAAVCEGYEEGRRTASQAEESLRREFVDDLLTGGSRGAQLLERAPAFGLRLEAAHRVLVVAGSRRFLDHRVMVRDVEAALRARAAGPVSTTSLLVATRSGLLVAVVAAELEDAARTVVEQLRREPALTWRLATSRPRAGATGVRMAFEEARSAVELAERLALPDPVVAAEDLMVHELLARDPERTVELVRGVLLPLQRARGGAAPLLATLRTYFACGSVAVAAAERLHLSVRAVTYRLDRVRALTGRDPGDPEDRFLLEVALRGAQVVAWPAVPLPPVAGRAGTLPVTGKVRPPDLADDDG